MSMATPAYQIEQLLDEAPSMTPVELSDLEKRLLNEFQRDLPLCAEPFKEIAARLDCSEADVLNMLDRLQDLGVVSRVGPVFRPKRAGASTLAAMAVPECDLEFIADIVSAYPEVNHNYEREHRFNLWFVMTACDEERLDAAIADMERCTGHAVMKLPLEKHYHIDLGFPLWC